MKIVNFRCNDDHCTHELEELVDEEEYQTILLNKPEFDCPVYGGKLKYFPFKNNSQVYKYLS
jgi:hypothetical protein